MAESAAEVSASLRRAASAEPAGAGASPQTPGPTLVVFDSALDSLLYYPLLSRLWCTRARVGLRGSCFLITISDYVGTCVRP